MICHCDNILSYMINVGPIVPRPKSAIHPLTALIGEAKTLTEGLKRAARSVHQKNEIPAAGRVILQLLDAQGSMTVPHIARLCCTSRQSIQMWVNRLKTEGYVDFISNPAHKRSDLARLTEPGRSFAVSVTKREVELLERVSSRVSQTEVLSAAAVLRRIELLLTGDPKLPKEAAGPGRKAAATTHRPSNRRRTASAKSKRQSVEPSVIAAQGSPVVEEDEFPLNLL